MSWIYPQWYLELYAFDVVDTLPLTMNTHSSPLPKTESVLKTCDPLTVLSFFLLLIETEMKKTAM